MVKELVDIRTLTILSSDKSREVHLKDNTKAFCIPTLLPDETAFSYFLRMSKLNCADSPIDLLNSLFNTTLTTRYFRPDGCGIDWDRIFVLDDGTTFTAATTTFALSALGNDNSLEVYALGRNKAHFISLLNTCPLCEQEDKDRYGFPYYHVSHSVSTATVCYKHSCALTNHYWKDSFNCKAQGDIPPSEERELAPLSYAKEYAVLIHDFLAKQNI